ncbi:methyltransferase [Planktothrix sp. FACHB-1355]|uniref:Methyltransferase n=1 Tax=Aerosakkonema funiforme FACHB-1375 TaxID=2949571 RepID=A0A926VHT3_9CYAN|nr:MULTISPECIES: methyltransferase [Oscillatoriales]MBD2184009.1 methyltransferase [Aerosakkonema funiforme FACHB-1375]MBD3557844.1 methyltransferase [Planktothrix sp. FACHB-1355]
MTTLLNFLDVANSQKTSVDGETLRLLKENRDSLKMSDLTMLLFGHAAFQYLYAGCELGVFELLSKEPDITKEEIGDRLNLEAYPTKCLMLGLTALKLVIKEGDTYRNSFVMQMLFVDGIWQEFYDTVLFEARIVYVGQLDFVESLRQNRNVGLRQFPGEGPDLYHRFIEHPEIEKVFYNYMGSWSRLANPLLIKNVDFSKFQKVVDVSGGDATNATTVAAAYPNVDITLLEIPASCPIAQKKIDAHGLTDRIHVRGVDIFVDEFPKGHDCFMFIHVLVIWTLEENTFLLRKAYEALEPGGSVIIFNSISSDDEDGPVMAALDSPYFMALPATGGMIYSWADHEKCLRDAGFTKMERIDCNAWTPHGIIIATK